MLPARLQDGIMPLMQRNAYWVHPEAVLLEIVADSDVAVRAQALVKSSDAASSHKSWEGHSDCRSSTFQPPMYYTELLEWEKEPITEPPLTTDLTDAAELQGIGT